MDGINHKYHFSRKVLLLCFLLPSISQASFIETTMGAAVVNDATASYFNPAALMLLKNTQIIPLGTAARFRSQFSGRSTVLATGITEQGATSSTTNYYSPSFYFGMPLNDKVTLGFAAVTNYANRDPEENSILRYVQSSNNIEDYDFVPSIGVKVNDYLSLGGGVNYSYTDFHLHPVSSYPGSNSTDYQSNNNSDGSGYGANAGFLFQPYPSTLIGFDYRTVTTYNESGNSTFNGPATVNSNNYHFTLRTPARGTFSISQLITPKFGIITTVQRIQWGILRNINVYNLATAVGTVNVSVPYYLHNSWIMTLGTHCRFQPNWIVRVAGTYNQSPDHGYYHVSTGDSYVLGMSLGYQFNAKLALDGSYAHSFIQNQQINVNGNRYIINGTNRASRDTVSLKATINI